MNFYADSSAGVSWEAGLVSTNQEVVNSIANAFSKVLAKIQGLGKGGYSPIFEHPDKYKNGIKKKIT